MGVVDPEKSFAAFAHQPLGSEKFFRGCFISNFRIRGGVSETINGLGVLVFISTNQATTFRGQGLTSVDENLFEL